MSQIINTNVYSLVGQQNLAKTGNSLQQAITRLSSGLRVNSASDDASGLAIATRMDSVIRGYSVAQRNANDGISMLQVADGSASNITDDLQRLRELAVQASNPLSSSDRANLSTEFTQLQAEITRIAQNTKFNGISVLDSAGSGYATSYVFQIGAGTDSASDQVTINFGDALTASTLLVDSATIQIDGSTFSNAQAAMKAIDSALNTLNTARSYFGAGVNRLNAAVSNLQVAITNQASAKSRIMDADYAQETANLTRSQILQQAGTAMLSQANQLPQTVLTLLR